MSGPPNGDVKLILGAVKQQGEAHEKQLAKVFDKLDALPCGVHLEKITSVEKIMEAHGASMSVSTPFGAVRGPVGAVIALVLLVGVGAALWLTVRDVRHTRNDIRAMVSPEVLEKIQKGVVR